MITLVIQTIRPEIEIMLFDENLEVIDLARWPSEKDEVAKVIPEMENLLAKNQLNFQDIGRILVMSGVGGFSSTRIGVTIANVLKMSTGAELYEMSSAKDQQDFDLIQKTRDFFAGSPRPVKLVQPIYGAEPMISPSKKQKLV